MKLTRKVSPIFMRWRRPAPPSSVLVAAALGAGLMYLLDPDRGARRRALLRDKSLHTGRLVRRLIGQGGHDLECRVHGLMAELRSLSRAEQVGDDVLVLRVRSKMGRVVSYPHAIAVTAQDGCITLRGVVLADEVDKLLSAVAAVPGVLQVDNQLEPHAARDQLPALQGSRRRSNMPVRERWSPLVRMAAGALGSGLLVYGFARRDRLGSMLGGAGAVLLIRDVQNRPLHRVLGMGTDTHAVDFHKTIHVRAPLEEVYAFFSHVENFPRFMVHLRDVRRLDGEGERYHWVAEGPAHLPVAWDGEIRRRVPNTLIEWRSLPGSRLRNAGIARFAREHDGRTRVDLQMSYNPPAGMVGHLVASLLGVDPKHAMDEDLVRLQSLLERGKTTAHGKEVRISDVLPGLLGH